MSMRITTTIISLIFLCCHASYSQTSESAPDDKIRMHELLTQKDYMPECCRYFYNFEHLAPGLYHDNQSDSILNIIEFIKNECGHADDLEITRILLLADQGRFDDSLIDSSTIGLILGYRWTLWRMAFCGFGSIYGRYLDRDSISDNFIRFNIDLGRKVASNADIAPAGRMIGLICSGEADSAFIRIQSPEFAGTKLRYNYDEYVERVRNRFRAKGNVCFSVGSWIPSGNIRLLGNHPEIGGQLGAEWKKWRGDLDINLRFVSAKHKYLVDSLGYPVYTKKYFGLNFGIDVGRKVYDRGAFSTDLFLGIGNELIYSISVAGDPKEYVWHNSVGLSIGLRHRFFYDPGRRYYIGSIIRLSSVNYDNPHGTDLSGSALSILLMWGGNFRQDLSEHFREINYKGSWRD